MSDSLFERGKALEDRFFSERDQELLDAMRQQMADKNAADALASVSGINDESVLAALVRQNVTVESLTSVSLIPLVSVAWADGLMETKEREAILKAAGESGIATDSPAYSLLQNWLTDKPDPALLQSWKEYVGALAKTLDQAALNQLKSSVVGRANQVAEAAGGFLGIGKISDQESAVLAELENSF